MALPTGNWCWGLVSILITIISVVIAYIKWSHTYWSRKNVISPKTTFLLGNAGKVFTQNQSFGENMLQVYNEYKNKGLKYCGYYIVLRPSWVVLDLDLIKDIMTKNFIHFTDHGVYTNEKTDPLTGQLFMQTGVKWKNLRAKLTPTFTSGKMKMMFPTLLDCSIELTNVMNKSVAENEVVDIMDIVGRYTTDIIGSCAFGVDCNSLKDPKSIFRHYGKMAFKSNIKQGIKHILASSWPWILNTLNIPMFPQELIDFFLNIVRETVDYREKNNIIRKDFMHLLIQLKNNVKVQDEESTGSLSEIQNNNQGKSLTIEQITAQAFVFFVAGFETSSTTLSFCFYELVSNPAIQGKLREEIEAVYKRNNGKLTYESLAEMTYMDKCIDETLRKYPPIPILMRECTEEYKVPGSNLVIEKGTRVLIPILGIQRDPEYYPDPEKFDPERFTREKKSERHPFTWLPFGEGPRICIGLRFGVMQTKVALAILLKNYRFSLNKKTVTPLEMDPKNFIMSTKDGIWLNVENV